MAATIYELTGISLPAVVEGVPQRPLEGSSLAYSLNDGTAPTRKDRQYFEMMAHRALWSDGWKAVTLHPSQAAALRIPDPTFEIRMGRFEEDEWELYHLAEDFSEAHNLAAQFPEKLAELQRLWWEDARRFNVLPLDDRLMERFFDPRPRVVLDQDLYRFTAPIRLVRSVSPRVNNREHHIRAIIEVPDPGCEGVLISNGGTEGGYCLCIHQGHLTYVSNYMGKEHFIVRAQNPLPAGRVEIVMSWKRTTDFAGEVTLFQNGELAGQGAILRTNPLVYDAAQGLEIGADSGTPVWTGYAPPFRFTGGLVEITLNMQGPLSLDPKGEERMARYIQ